MTRPLRALMLAIAAGLWAVPTLAHDVQAVIAEGPPRQITLTYGDGEPFAYEAYELRPQDAPLSAAPVQAGRTSAAGVIVLGALQGPATPLRLRAFSADGHGVDRVLPAASGTATPGTSRLPGLSSSSATATALTPATTTAERIVRGVAGLLVIGALYGLWLALRRRREALRARTTAAQD